MTSVTMELNGDKISYEVEPRESLADFLRERCRLTATHLGCEHGACGTCTVAVDGKATRSCLRLAVMCNGRKVQTLEGMEEDATWSCCGGISTQGMRSSAAFARPGC
jgi:aerobic carbon-monoxide dehydrogenase small subunit